MVTEVMQCTCKDHGDACSRCRESSTLTDQQIVERIAVKVPSSALQKARELAEKHDSTIFLIEDSPTASEILEHRFSGKDASHVAKMYNAFPSIASLCLEQAEEIKRLRGALDILKRNVVVAVRRAERGLRTQANPLSGLKAVVEALPPIETLVGMTPLCDRCNEACFKDCSKYCDIVLCQKCSDTPSTLSANSPSL